MSTGTSAKRVLHVVTNVDHFADGTPTGLWLSELIHVYDQLADARVEQVIASPAGGLAPLEPRSLLPLVADKATKARLHDPAFMALLNSTTPLAEVDWQQFDAIYLTGGHGVMYDFPASEALATLVQQMSENGRIVASVCHGYCGFRNATNADGTPFVKDRSLTGFSWVEEQAALVAKKVPYNVQQVVTDQGANYTKATVPMFPHVVVDGRLVTGQNPTSAKGVGKELLRLLGH